MLQFIQAKYHSENSMEKPNLGLPGSFFFRSVVSLIEEAGRTFGSLDIVLYCCTQFCNMILTDWQ